MKIVFLISLGMILTGLTMAGDEFRLLRKENAELKRQLGITENIEPWRY